MPIIFQVLLLLLLNRFALALGVPTVTNICPPVKGQLSDNEDVAKYMLKAAQIGPPDRKSAQSFGGKTASRAEVERRFGGSGDFVCGPDFGQAQVILNGDTIITSAHMLMPSNTCDGPVRSVDSCKFTLRVEGKIKAYEIDRPLDTGYRCPHAGVFKTQDDWVVLKLKEKVDSRVKPYKVGRANAAAVQPGAQVIQVAKSNDFTLNGAKLMADAERHYANCSIKYAYGQSVTSQLETDLRYQPQFIGRRLVLDGSRPNPDRRGQRWV